MIRWALAGASLGAAVAALVFAPASWLASTLSDATDQRVVLAEARGSVWRGSAVMVLTGGPGSRTASALPGRIQWSFGLDGAALVLSARHACCITGELHLRVRPGFGRTRVELVGDGARGGAVGLWPASWLVGLGTPWNTLQPSGTLQLSSPGLAVEQVQGRWLFSGKADLELVSMASRMSTLDVLGSYRLNLSGDADKGLPPRIQLSTLRGPLQLSGDGQWAGIGASSRLRFTGQASAEPGSEASLGGLLNIIGRRQGALSVISIG